MNSGRVRQVRLFGLRPGFQKSSRIIQSEIRFSRIRQDRVGGLVTVVHVVSRVTSSGVENT